MAINKVKCTKGAYKMAVTSVEYQTIRKNRSLLKDAMVDSVQVVSSELLRVNMITNDNHTELMNNTLTKHDRVEMLMMYIENRVKLNPTKHFTMFVDVLKMDKNYYSDAIQVLHIPACLQQRQPQIVHVQGIASSPGPSSHASSSIPGPSSPPSSPVPAPLLSRFVLRVLSHFILSSKPLLSPSA